MPLPLNRPSLITTLDQRYATQRSGGAFSVKQVLGAPGTVPAPGTTIDAASMNGQKFQSPNGFEVKMMPGITQMLDAQSNTSKQLSMYIKGFDNTKYRP